jgi:LPXTG-motif cell wall-anchored protein
MVMLNTLAVLLAQSTTETGKTNQTSWFPMLIVGLLLAVLVAGFFIRRGRRALGDPPAGSVPATDVPEHLQSGRMSPPQNDGPTV